MSSTGVSPEPPSVPADEPPRGRRRPGRPQRIVLAAAAAVVVVVASGLYVASRDSSPPPLDEAQAGKIASGVVKKAIEDLRSAPATSATVYQQILPSLVQIETNDSAANGSGQGLGAGVIVNRNGTILTALHVVEGAQTIRVSFADGSTSEAAIASADPPNDIAVLMPQRGPEVIVPAVLGGGGQVGDEAYAIGHPLGYSGSLTSGVISGLDRATKAPNGATMRGLIQFDAAVNPGNSGGPLLNRAGQVIGIVTALANPSRDDYFIGIGFAVPIGTAGGAANAPPK